MKEYNINVHIYTYNIVDITLSLTLNSPLKTIQREIIVFKEEFSMIGSLLPLPPPLHYYFFFFPFASLSRSSHPATYYFHYLY